MSSIPSFPQHFQPSAALLLEQTLPPGNSRPGCGREVWVERQRDSYDLLSLFWQILNKHLGKALNSGWKIPAASRRGAPRSCRCPQQPPPLPPGIVLPSSSRLSAAQIVQEHFKSLRLPTLGAGRGALATPAPLNPKMRLWRLWWPGGDVVAAVGEQQNPALLLLRKPTGFSPNHP